MPNMLPRIAYPSIRCLTMVLIAIVPLFGNRLALGWQLDGVHAEFQSILDRYNQFDFDGDGHQEIEQLKWLKDCSGAKSPGVLVLIEERLLEQDLKIKPAGELREELKKYAAVLEADQLQPYFVSARVEKSERHQDGLTLLALRRYLQDLQHAFPEFKGVVMIGSFPEAMLVRRWAWLHSSRSVKLDGVTYNKGQGPKATYLAFDPELISHRSDVVLCDLTGNWEDIYVQGETKVDSIKLIPDDPEVSKSIMTQEMEFSTQRFSIRPKKFQDFFFIDDAQLKIVSRDDTRLRLSTTYQMQLPEVSDRNRQLPNPLATPDILLSRINPLHVAANPPAHALDEEGTPQVFSVDSGAPEFQRSPQLERQLLIEYLVRNRQHRSGSVPDAANRSALLTTDIKTFETQYLQKLSDRFSKAVAFHKADVIDFVKFMKTPAVLKGISAHSGPNTSVLIRGFNAIELAKESGANYWQWQKKGDQYTPSYADKRICNSVNTALLRTLWNNRQLPDIGSFYIHGGCEAISPNGAAKYPYHSVNYGGHTQIAESLLFYGNGLALIGRAKVFYDRPRNPDRYFSNTKGRFGDILRGYFEEETADPKVGRDVAGRNRAYFWSILGDWTLRLDYSEPRM